LAGSDIGFTEILDDGEMDSVLHSMAEEQNMELLNLLLDRALSDDWYVKTGALPLIGFHYDLSANEGFLDYLRSLISAPNREDNGDYIRITAANVLGEQVSSVDEKDIKMLDVIDSRDVRLALMRSLMRRTGLKYNRISTLTDLLEKMMLK